MGIYVQPVVQNHGCHVEFMIPFDPDSPGETDRVRALEGEAVEHLAQAGAFAGLTGPPRMSPSGRIRSTSRSSGR